MWNSLYFKLRKGRDGYKKWLKNQKGLTLVELLAVIVILGIIAAIAVPAIANIIDNSRKDAHLANAEALYDAARLAVIGEEINDVTTFTATGVDNDDDLVNINYLDTTPENPEGDSYNPIEVIYTPDENTYRIVLGDVLNSNVDGEPAGALISDIRSWGRAGFDDGNYKDPEAD